MFSYIGVYARYEWPVFFMDFIDAFFHAITIAILKVSDVR